MGGIPHDADVPGERVSDGPVEARRSYVVGAVKIPHEQRNVAHAVLTPEDDRGFFNVIGADDGAPDGHTLPVGSLVSYRVELNDEEADRFRQASNCRYVEADVWHHQTIGPMSMPAASSMQFMGADFARMDQFHGRDVIVAVLDGGTTTAVREFLGATMTARQVFSTDQPGADEITSDHGCLVAACLVPAGGKLVDAIVAENSGGALASTAAAAMRWAADQGAKVINYSFAGTGGSQAQVDSIQYLQGLGVQLFAGAGNEGANEVLYPAAYSTTYDNVHSSIAFNEETNTRASFSNYATTASGCAPGNKVLGLYPNGLPRTWNGTSASTPHMAQLCARGATGGRFTAAQVGAALKANTRDTGQPAAEQGGGAYDLEKALTALGAFTNLPAPAFRRNLSPNPSIEANSTGYAISSTRGGITATSPVRNTAVATPFGTAQLALGVTGNGTSGGPTTADVSVSLPSVPVTAGQPYTFSVHSRISSGAGPGGPSMLWAVLWMNSTGAVVSQSQSANYSLMDSVWARYNHTATAPAGATEARLWLYTYNFTSTSLVAWRLDGFQVEQTATLGTYFDGATAGARWEGTANNSPSSVGAVPGGGTGGETGTDYHPGAMIWPTSGRFPDDGAYAFIESGRPGDNKAEAFLNYPHSPAVPTQQERVTRQGVDLSQWHHFAIEKSPTGIKGFLDGVEWFSYAGGAITGTRKNIQDMPSGRLLLLLDNFTGNSGLTPAAMEVDWVRAYSLVPTGPSPDPDPDPGPDPDPDPGPGGTQTLGVGGVATPPGAILATSDQPGVQMNITQGGTADNYRVYDGQGHTIGQIKIRADYLIVQNYRVRSNNNLGISIGYGDAKVNHVVVQNNDIKDLRAPGDINALEVWGDDITIAYNTAIDAITGDAGGSHTDFIQTWNTNDGWNTTNLRVVGNRATGEPDDANESVNTHFNQALIGEGADCSSGGGGSGQSGNWFISDNYWTADCKFCDIDNVTYTRNTFAGIDKRAVVIQGGSTGFKYYSDNKITGQATVEVGAPIIPGPGPAAPTWPGKGTPGSGGGGGGSTPIVDPGPAGDFNWKGLNWTRRTSSGAPQFNGQFSAGNVSGPDSNGYITLNLTNPTGSAPIASEFYTTRQGFGYGTYTCVIGTRLDTLNKATVFGGLFTYDSTQSAAQSHNEIDICETSAWGAAEWDIVLDHNYYIDDSNSDGAPESVGNSFPLTGTNIPVHTHQMIWEPNQITMRSYSGTGTGGTLLHETIRTSSLPTPDNERIHFNLWVFDLNPTPGGVTKVQPATAPATSVVVRDFSFVPASSSPNPNPNPGGGGTPATTLAGRLKIGKATGLTKVNLGIGFLPGQGPSGKQGTHVDFWLPELENNFTYPGYVDLQPDGAVRLTNYIGGGHTPNSVKSRTEFRELKQDGVTRHAWDDRSGEHYVWIDVVVRRACPGRPDICLVQIHAADDDLGMIKWVNGSVISTYGDSGRPGTLATGVAVGTRMKLMMKTTRVGSQTQIGYYYNDMTTPKATQNYGGAAGNYSKAGNYNQSDPSTDDVGESAVIDVYGMGMWHTGDPEQLLKF
jgi:hypothetical protein